MTDRIARIEAFEIRVPLPTPLLLGAMHIDAREYAIVRVCDASGNQGTAYGYTRGAPIAETIRRLLVPQWTGRSLAEHPVIYDGTVKANVFLGTNGIFWRALSLVDCAVFDLLARRANQPLHAYLGGKQKTTPMILAGCYPTVNETFATLRECAAFLGSFQPAGIKVTSSGDFDHDTRRLGICRETLPDGPPFINDIYCSAVDVAALVDEAQRWSELGMLWIEDPFGFDDFENYALLADRLPYPVAAGDEQSGRHHFSHLVKHGHVSIIRLDATVCGGVTGFLDIARLAAQLDIPISCHVFPFLHSQLAAAVPNARWVEHIPPECGVDSIHLAWRRKVQWSAGGLTPTAEPGIGYEWDQDKIDTYRIC